MGTTLESRLLPFLFVVEHTLPETNEDTSDVILNIESELQQIAQELVACGNSAKLHLEKLVRSNLGESLFRLGQEIAANDSDLQALEIITNAMASIGERSNSVLITGYLYRLRDLDKAKHDFVICGLANKIPSADLNLNILLRSRSLLASTTQLVSDLILVHDANPEALTLLGADDLRVFDATTLHSFVDKLLKKEKLSSVNAACRILYRRYGSVDSLEIVNLSLIREVVLSDIFWSKGSENVKGAEKIDYAWLDLFKKYVADDSDSCRRFAKRYFYFISSDKCNMSFYYDSPMETAFDTIVRSQHIGVWDCFFDTLESVGNNSLCRLLRWISQLHTHTTESVCTGYWFLVPIDRLFRWIDRDLSKRVRLVCSFLPSLIHERGVFEPTKAFLLRYWDLDPCCWEKVHDVNPTGIYGRLSDHYLRRISWVVEALAKEKDSIVEAWLRTMLECYTKELERAKEEEKTERERFFTRSIASDSNN